MTSDQWWGCTHLDPLWTTIFPVDADEGDYPSSRKARLFGSACWRRVWKSLRGPALHRAIEAAEEFADATGDNWAFLDRRREEAESGVQTLVRELIAEIPLDPESEEVLVGYCERSGESLLETRRWMLDPEMLASAGVQAAEGVLDLVAQWPDYLDRYLVSGLGPAAARAAASESDEPAIQCDYFRCIFRPTPGGRSNEITGEERESYPSWVLSLAEAAYRYRNLPLGTLEADRLAVLSDALEQVGCSSPALLAHLRSPGPHVRGCWALDEILGKE